KFQALLQDHKHHRKILNTYQVLRHGNNTKLQNIIKDYCPFFSVINSVILSSPHPHPIPMKEHLPPKTTDRGNLVNDFVQVHCKLSWISFSINVVKTCM
ncbi:hypothetical protein DBR06_SOUSAS810122, partial [Sousa chinensis]